MSVADARQSLVVENGSRCVAKWLLLGCMRSKIQYLAQPFNKMDSNKLDELILKLTSVAGWGSLDKPVVREGLVYLVN